MNDLIGEDQTGILVARDMLTLLLCGFVACAVLAVPFMNDPEEGRCSDGGSAQPAGQCDRRCPVARQLADRCRSVGAGAR